MQRRLFDKATLKDVRILAASLTVTNMPDAKQSAHATFEISVDHQLHDEESAGRPLQISLSVSLTVSSKENPELRFFTVSSGVAGIFLLDAAEDLNEKVLLTSRPLFARMLFPVARAEVARLLTGAKFNDVPLGWDLGPFSITDEERDSDIPAT